MDNEIITKKNTDKDAKPLLLVIGMMVLSFAVTVTVNSFNQYGGFTYFKYPLLIYVMIGESISGLIIFPLIHIAIASIWKSKRNKRTRRNVFFGWALVTAAIYLFGGIARIQNTPQPLNADKVITNSESGKQANHASPVRPVSVRQAAEQGDAEAQFKLGVWYDNGEGVLRDDAQAAVWYRKAAEQGLTQAQFNLGMMYAQGEGVAQDNTQALAWFHKAAEQGYADAQFSLGVMYSQAQDDTQALAWYQKAAEQGHAGAQLNLALMYDNGRGAPQNDQQALFWYRKAAEQGIAQAQHNLGVMYDNGQGVPEDYVQANAWFSVAATNGNADSAKARDATAKLLNQAQLAEAQKLAARYLEGAQPK